MKKNIAWHLAFRFLGFNPKSFYLSQAKKSLYGAAVGIGISLVPLIATLSLTNGMIQGISTRLIELSSSHIRVIDYSKETNTQKYLAELKQTHSSIKNNQDFSFIQYSFLEREGLGIAVGSLGRSGATIRAVEPGYFEIPSVKELFKLYSGKLGFNSNNQAIIGTKLAEGLGLKEGDTFRLLTVKNSENGKTIPKFISLKVAGVASTGYEELDSLWIFIPFEVAESVFDKTNSHAYINIFTHDPFNALDYAKTSLNRFLPNNFYAYTWKELHYSQFKSLNTTKTLLTFIIGLLLLIASINISSALVMLVMEHKKDIAILKSLGICSSDLIYAFVISGFLTGLGGLIIGMPLGILCALHINSIFHFIESCINSIQQFLFSFTHTIQVIPVKLLDPAYYLQEIPIKIELIELLLIALITVLLSIFVSLGPAYKVAKEKPIEVMKKI